MSADTLTPTHREALVCLQVVHQGWALRVVLEDEYPGAVTALAAAGLVSAQRPDVRDVGEIVRPTRQGQRTVCRWMAGAIVPHDAAQGAPQAPLRGANEAQRRDARGNDTVDPDAPCPHPARGGRHEWYVDGDLARGVCRACGARKATGRSAAMIDTARILVTEDCNLACPYCCNKKPEVRARLRPVATLDEIGWSRYRAVCITGGEPLLYPQRVREVYRWSVGLLRVLYTNGILLTADAARDLQEWGVSAVNVGLHAPEAAAQRVVDVLEATRGTRLAVRFHIQDRWRQVIEPFCAPERIRTWHKGDCDMPNEDWFVWLEAAAPRNCPGDENGGAV